MSKIYDTKSDQAVSVAVQVIPNVLEMVTAQEAFGWALDHIWVEKTKQGTKELAVLIQVLSLSNLQPLNEQQLRLNK